MAQVGVCCHHEIPFLQTMPGWPGGADPEPNHCIVDGIDNMANCGCHTGSPKTASWLAAACAQLAAQFLGHSHIVHSERARLRSVPCSFHNAPASRLHADAAPPCYTANCRDGVRGAPMLHGADPECANAGNAEPLWPSAFACNDCDATRETTWQLPLGPTGSGVQHKLSLCQILWRRRRRRRRR